MDSDLFKNRNLADDEETIAKTINYLKLNDHDITDNFGVDFSTLIKNLEKGDL